MREGFTTNPHLLSSGLLADKMQNGRGVHSKNIQIRQEGRNVYSKVSKDKSYKDALLEHLKPQMQDETHVVGGQKKEKSSGRETINIMASIPSSDLDWLNQCFVGQVKGMYDADFVQQALRSDGFKVKVSVWSGFYVIIHCLEVEQVAILWDLKQSLLESWFEEIDTLANFMSETKLKIWVSIEGIPIHAWHPSVIKSVASHWGKVIKVDEDTISRNIFDCAWVLVGVSSVSDISLFVDVSINGEKFNVKVSTSEFEDNRCWIDEGRVEFPSEAGWEDEGRSRLEERNQDFNDLTAKEVSKKKGSLMIRERVKEVKGASLSPSVGWTRNQIMGMGWRDYNSLGLKSLMVQLIFQ
ncbi:hypothetical protein V6N12_010493 [Hibiscus sabdariffa]|uniref:DUF4283 domain-containing protein n=1 Tax=Hibiscus sabdariffa TaxID=183260 RepID=A0ABR2EMM4_9ROSI